MSFTSPAIWRSTQIFANGRRVYATLAPLTFTLPDGRRFTVPAGFLTDLASVPSIARGLFAPDGPWAESAIVHDWLLYTGEVSHDEADRIFRLALTSQGVPAWRRWSMWGAVRIGSATSDGRDHLAQHRNSPAMAPGFLISGGQHG